MVVHYTEEAENDLFEIGVYTWTEWGEEQFVKYMALLRETCEDVIPRKHRFARPYVYPRRNQPRPGKRREKRRKMVNVQVSEANLADIGILK